MTAEFIVELLGMVGVGVGVYAGIRSDLAELHVKTDMAIKAAERAHERLDTHFDERRA